MTRTSVSWRLVLAVTIALIVIFSCGYVLYRGQEQSGERAINRELATVSQLKGAQIAQWRTDMATRVDLVRNSPLFIKSSTQLFNTPDDAVLKAEVIKELANIKSVYSLQDIGLVDGNRKTIVNLTNAPEDWPESTNEAFSTALKSRQTMWSDIYMAPGSNKPQIDIVAPLISTRNGSEYAVGALIFSFNPSQDLYPLIQSWPTTSNSAEIMLIKKEGNQAVLLNELRHLEGAALKLKIPLSNEQDPAAAAVEGAEGAFSGTDYRGKAVLAALQPVADSDWYVAVKIDRSEIFATRNMDVSWATGTATATDRSLACQRTKCPATASRRAGTGLSLGCHRN